MANSFSFGWTMPEEVPLSSHSQTFLDRSQADSFWNPGSAEYIDRSSFDASNVQVDDFFASGEDFFGCSRTTSDRDENYGYELDTPSVSAESSSEGLQNSLPQATPADWPQNLYDADRNAPWSALSLQESHNMSLPFQDLGLGPDIHQQIIPPLPSIPDLNIGTSHPHQQYQWEGLDFGNLDSHYALSSSFDAPAMTRQFGIQPGRHSDIPDNTSGDLSNPTSWPASPYKNQTWDFGTPTVWDKTSLPGPQEPLRELPRRRRGSTPSERRQSKEAQANSSRKAAPLPIAALLKKQGHQKERPVGHCPWPNCSNRKGFGRGYEYCRHYMTHFPGNKRPCLLCPAHVQAKKVYSRKDNVQE